MNKYHVDLVALHITQVCSHRCPFCYASADDMKPQHPPFNKLKEVVNALGFAKVKELALLGGDPACYPYVVDLAKYAINQGMDVSILSNTLSFPNSSIEEASKYIGAFETTIHHVEPEVHDKFCGKKGAYKKVIRQLSRAAALGKKTGIAINIIPGISNKIFELINRIVNIEKIFLDYIIIQRIVPFGRAANSSKFTLTRKHADEALREIKMVDKELGIKISVEDPFPLCVLSDELKKYMNPCQWGFTKAAVSYNGDLSRCGADPRYRLGNIIKTPLLEIWNKSEVLNSFRKKNYLPGRCRICSDFQKCGGGCPLSCEMEKDHGIDYLFLEYEKLDQEIHGEFTFSLASEDELSSILQIEWSNFPGYGHIFSVESLKKWYRHNPRMFRVVSDSRNWILGYTTVVPIKKSLFNKIINGKFSSLDDFPENEVLKKENTNYFHIEVLATVPSRTASRAGRYLINCIGTYLLENAKHVSTSPITEIGLRLCKYFGFTRVAEENVKDENYPIYLLNVKKDEIKIKLQRF